MKYIHRITDCKTPQQLNLAVSGRFYPCNLKKKTSCGFICPEPGKCLNHRQGVEGSFGRPFCQKLHHTFVLLTARILRALRPIIKILIKWIKKIDSLL